MSQSFAVAGSRVFVTLGGKIHLDQALELRSCLWGLLAQGHINFTVDVKRLRYIDGVGLGVLVALHRQAQRQGGGVTVQGIGGALSEILTLAHLNGAFAAPPERTEGARRGRTPRRYSLTTKE